MTFYASGRKEQRTRLLAVYARLKNTEHVMARMMRNAGSDDQLSFALENVRLAIRDLIAIDAQLEGFR